MALVTITDMYLALLKGVGKKNSSAVWPADFNDVINRAYKEWLSHKSDESDIVQKRMDDLQKLRYVTDGSIELPIPVSDVEIDGVGGEVALNAYNSITGLRTLVELSGTGPVRVRTRVYQTLIPIVPVLPGVFPIVPVNYPKYYRSQSVLVMVSKNNVDYGYVGSSPLRDDQKSNILEDPYSVPYVDIKDLSRSRVYHQYMQDRLKLFLPIGFIAKNIQLSYIKLPTDLNYDPNYPANNINCELGSIQQQQIVDLARRMYIEGIESRRYQTVMAEQQQGSN
jgi:hypothetical protein